LQTGTQKWFEEQLICGIHKQILSKLARRATIEQWKATIEKWKAIRDSVGVN
jgi:U3 small nucleolar RNA-associated protein 14